MKTVVCEPDTLALAVRRSRSWSELANLLGYTSRSGEIFRLLQQQVEAYNLSTSHFRAPSRKPFKHTPESGLRLFAPGSARISGAVLTRLLLELGCEHECAECALPAHWNGKALKLQVDHKDGNPLNNQKENLRFLCPNCHSQTHNWGGRNAKRQAPAVLDSERYALLTIASANNTSRKQAARVRLIEQAAIDFSKWGWVAKVATLLGLPSQKVRGWMLKYMPLQLKEAVTRADRVAANVAAAAGAKRRACAKTKLRIIEAEEEFAKGYGWLSRLAVRWGIGRAAARRWVINHVPRLYSQHEQATLG